MPTHSTPALRSLQADVIMSERDLGRSPLTSDELLNGFERQRTAFLERLNTESHRSRRGPPVEWILVGTMIRHVCIDAPVHWNEMGDGELM